MRVAVGCPIRDRAWIFPTWFDHVEVAFEVAGLKPEYVFVSGTSADGTDDLLDDVFSTRDGMWKRQDEPDAHLPPGDRNWCDRRYTLMVHHRNELLTLVRALEPDYFLSVDSDILLHPTALVALLETIEHGHPTHKPPSERTFPVAVGGKAYLHPTLRRITNYAQLNRIGGLQRDDADGVFVVDVLMALKLMNSVAYSTDYVYSDQGEDIGWSNQIWAAGHQLVWDGRVGSKHVMHPRDLDGIDPRLGW